MLMDRKAQARVPRRWPSLGWLVALLSAGIGCGGDAAPAAAGGSSGGASNRADALAVCEAHVGFVERCESDPDFGYDREWGENECPLDPWRYVEPVFIKAYAACLKTLACSEYDDQCAAEGAEALGVDAVQLVRDPLFQQCQGVAARCDQDPDAERQVGDLCERVTLFTRAGRSWLEDCLEKPCDGIFACTDAP